MPVSSDTQHLSVDEVLAIHQGLISRFGGLSGVRDLGLLESALYRPRTGYYRDLAEMATALFESLLMNHPFVDGNKRVAFFATDVFLRLNGWSLRVEAAEAHRSSSSCSSSISPTTRTTAVDPSGAGPPLA